MAGHSNNPMAPLSTPWKVGKPMKFYFGVGQRWLPSFATYSIFGACMVLYFTDLKMVVTKIPFYGSKFTPKHPIT